mmetsp:Transcript_32271/g.47331  ORF Transcript_32271/g.47331 Transcript_32271/m.47331 type:complete len:290 (-) Transcript_32271:118-987(-)
MQIPQSLLLTYYIFILLSSSTIIQLKTVNAQEQDPTTMNGGSIMAMSGQNCVAIAVDKRFGSGPQMVNVSPRNVLIPNSKCLVAFTGLGGDCQSLAEELSILISEKMMGKSSSSGFGFGLEESYGDGSGGEEGGSVTKSIISPRSMASLTSHVLYGRRRSPYYVEPIIAGLEPVVVEEEERGEDDETTTTQKRKKIQYRPYLCAQDVIGAKSQSESFVCSGVASKSLYGTAEAMWRPNLKPDELARVCGRAFLSALERDCLSGYGAIVYVILGGENGGIMEYDLACRSD